MSDVLAPSNSHPVMSDFTTLIVSTREVRLPEENMTRPLLLPLTPTCINDTVSETSFYVQYSCKLTSKFPFAGLRISGFILVLFFNINSTSPQLSHRETFIVVHPLDSVSTSQLVSFLDTFSPGTGFRLQSAYFKNDNLSGN